MSVELTNGTVLNLGNIKGTNGIGVSKVEINSAGELIFTYTNGFTDNLGVIMGADGADGAGIKSVTLSVDGELIITMSDNSVVNLGNIKGAKGDKGDTGEKGADGKDGRGIAKTELVNGELIIHYTDGTSDNLGSINADVTDSISMLKFTIIDAGENQGSLSVSIKDDYKNIVENIVIPSTYNGRAVTRIDRLAFKDCFYLQSVTIPNSCLTVQGRE